MKQNKNEMAFFALLRAGLWERGTRLLAYETIDFSIIQELAEEQSVVGIIAAGLEHVEDTMPSKLIILQIISQTLQLEQRNAAMNYFIGVLVDKMRKVGINTLLVKGQGIAQCYERPLWRTCGDVDFYLSDGNYQTARDFLVSLASHVDEEDKSRLHLSMKIDSWVVELHGTMHSDISDRIDRELDDVHDNIFCDGAVRCWKNADVTIYLPSVDNDIIIVFTHFLKHFYVGGIGLRQICDWCRLLWTYRNDIDRYKLKLRIKAMGLMMEWKAFAAFSVDYLGIPFEAMPLYSSAKCYRNKAKRICNLILEMGNFGQNKDESYRSRYPRFIEKTITFFRRFVEFVRISTIFPSNAPKFFLTYVLKRVKAMV